MDGKVAPLVGGRLDMWLHVLYTIGRGVRQHDTYLQPSRPKCSVCGSWQGLRNNDVHDAWQLLVGGARRSSSVYYLWGWSH